ncbi:hypothetical protein PLESTB_000485500 [Pleodorina starrii]|uniref:FIST domain-containing protein n=1 Tax=Pleodorina starrii TaxID=330485 RepID=A0A9W6BGD2_9CHLO|nr:hypothetical protein PLESTM_000356700 [Pleodorina starrii]GLC51280.1 hypothetical protein PLESTB_000485500 [Pleodorina starrii]GLC63640.1 hypothetical protein PLESTF_000058400 [Pleodorina starrii]
MRLHAARGVARAVATSCAMANGSTQRGFYFVSASYQGRSLLSAATELAQTVREAMGPDRPPHLITLFATPHAEWGAGLADTPQYVRELLTYDRAQPPVILGGVLRSVAAGSSALCKEGGPCVALLAAHLPGVKLMPFHTTQSSLPALPGDGWAEVMRATRAITSAKAAAAAAAPAAAVDAASASEFRGRQQQQQQQQQPGDGGDAASVLVGSSARPSGGGGGGGVGVAGATQRPVDGSQAAAATAAAGPSSVPAGPIPGTATEDLHRGHQYQQLQQPHQQLKVRQEQPTAGSCGRSGAVDAAAAVAAGNPGRLPPGDAPPALPPPSPPKAPCSVAALLLSTPHFTEVEELLRRFGQVAPGMQVFGGVTSPGAWGESESNWGAVWLNDRTFAQGAVGCVLQGPFKLDTIVSPGFRGAGPVMRVTQAHGTYVLELDGEPVQRPLQRAISEALNSGELATSLKIGLGDSAAAAAPATSTAAAFASSSSSSSSSSNGSSGSNSNHLQKRATAAAHARQRPQAVFPSQPPHPHPHPHQQQAAGAASNTPQHQPQQQQDHQPQPQPQQPQGPADRQFLTRNWFFQQGPPRPFMTVQSSAPITNGTPIQVHLQNYPAAHRHMRDRLREYAEALPVEVTAAEGSVGALALSCSALPFFEGPDVERCLPAAAFAGGKVEGEFCSTVEGQPSRLHSFASCLAFLRAAETP